MSNEEITNDIRDFIRRYIRSVGHLEALLLFVQNEQQEWDADLISKSLRTNTSYANRQIADLSGSGLIIKTKNGKFVCCQSDSPHYGLVHKLQAVYKTRPSSIISLVYEQPNENLRGFIDAFNIKKDKD